MVVRLIGEEAVMSYSVEEPMTCLVEEGAIAKSLVDEEPIMAFGVGGDGSGEMSFG